MMICSCFGGRERGEKYERPPRGDSPQPIPEAHGYAEHEAEETLTEEQRLTLVAEIDRTRSPSTILQLEPQLIVGPILPASQATRARSNVHADVADYQAMISTIQELMALPSTGHQTTNVIPRYMATLCKSLGLSYCKLTALSTSGVFHQHLGSATMGEPDPLFLSQAVARTKGLSASQAFIDRVSDSNPGYEHGEEPSSRESLRPARAPQQVHGDKPASCTSHPSLITLVSRGAQADPMTFIIDEDASNINNLPSDLQPMVLSHGLRSIACIPIGSGPPPPSAKADDSSPLFNQSQLLGCLTIGSTSPLEWKSQGWFQGLTLLMAWTSGVLSNHRSMRVLDFFEAVQGSSSIEEMASAFIHLFPSPSIQDDLMQVEVRLALVFSKLNRAAIFVPSSSSSRPLSNNGSKSSFRDSTTVNQSTLVSSMISSGFSASGSFNMYRHGSLKSGTVLSLDYTISEEGDDEKEEELPAGTNPSDSSSTNGVEQEPSFSRSSKMRASLSPSSSKRSSLSKRLPNDSSSLSLLPSQSGLGPPAGPSSRKHRSVVTLAGALSAGYIQIGDGANGPEAGDPRGSSGGSQRKDDRTSTSRNTKDRSSYISWRSSHAERIKMVQRIEIPTDGTMIMSSLEAGDMMVVKDSIAKNKLLPPDLSLDDCPCPTGTQILLLPLIYRSRPMGCVYVFIRSGNFGAGWNELGEMISKLVFGKLSGELRAEWSATMTEEPYLQSSGDSSSPTPGAISAPLFRLQASGSLNKYSRRATAEGEEELASGPNEQDNGDPRFVKSSSLGRKVNEAAEDQSIVLTTNQGASDVEFIQKHSSSSTASMDEREALCNELDRSTQESGDGSPTDAGRLTRTQIAAAMSKSKSTSLNQLGKGEMDMDLDAFTAPPGIVVSFIRDSQDQAAEDANDSARSSINDPSRSTGPRLTYNRPSHLPEVSVSKRVLMASRSMPARPRSRVSFSPSLGVQPAKPEGTKSSFDATNFLLSSQTPSVPLSSPNAAEKERTTRTSAPGTTPNAPGSGLSSTKLVKLNPAINRVLKANKLVEPYINRSDRKHKLQRSHASETQASPATNEPVTDADEGAQEDTSLMEAEAEDELSASRSTSLSLVAAKELINAAISYSPLPRDLALWPELIKMGLEFHSSQQKSLYFSEFEGQPTLLKVLRRPATLIDSRPCISTRHLKLLQRLSEISHANVIRLLMVYPSVFEITQGDTTRSLRDDPRVQICGMQPRRGKYRRCCALLTENFDRSISLAVAITSGLLLQQGNNNNTSSRMSGRIRPPQAQSSFLMSPGRSLMVVGGVGSNSRGDSKALNPRAGSEAGEGEEAEEGGDVFDDEGSLDPRASEPLGKRRMGRAHSSMGGNRSTPRSVNSRGLLILRLPNLALIRVILIQVATGLRALHQSGLLHGEVTPENVLLLMPPAPSIEAETTRTSVSSTSGYISSRLVDIQSRSSLNIPPHPRTLAKSSSRAAGSSSGHPSSPTFQRMSEANAPLKGTDSKLKASVTFMGYASSSALVGGKQLSDRSSRESPVGSSLVTSPSTGPKSAGISNESNSTMNRPSMMEPAASTPLSIAERALSKMGTPPTANSPISESTLRKRKKKDKRSQNLGLLKQPELLSAPKGASSSKLDQSSNVELNLTLESSDCPSDTSDLGLLSVESLGHISPAKAPKVPSSKTSDLTPLRPDSFPTVTDSFNPLANDSIRSSNNLQGARLSHSFFTNNSVSGRFLQVQVKLKDAAMCTLTLDPPRLHGSTSRLPVTVQKLAYRPRPSRLAPYLPPEVVVQRQRPKRAADIYAFGVLMWEMYNGRRAAREVEAPDEVFLDPQPKSMVAEASKDQLMELEWPPETPSLYRSLAEKCMSHEIDERPNLKSILRTLVQMTD